MDIRTKNGLRNILSEYSKLTEREGFYFYFNIRGSVRIRGDFSNRVDRFHNIEVLFLRIYKTKYNSFIGGHGIYDESLLILK
jgi:hypothetical protein